MNVLLLLNSGTTFTRILVCLKVNAHTQIFIIVTIGSNFINILGLNSTASL